MVELRLEFFDETAFARGQYPKAFMKLNRFEIKNKAEEDGEAIDCH